MTDCPTCDAIDAEVEELGCLPVVTWGDESWKRAAHSYHVARRGTRTVLSAQTEPGKLKRIRRLMAGDISLDRAYAELNDNATDGAAASTVEALAYQLRAGVTALRNPSALRRIAELDEQQMREVGARLDKERWSLDGKRRVPPWTSTEIETFVETWRRIRHGY
jgi:hypothetical protein